MAVPHKKRLVGKEAGGKSIHWYDFLESKRRILKSKKWMGPRTNTKSGTKIVVWLGFVDGIPKWGSVS